MSVREEFEHRANEVRERLERACAQAGRRPDEITVVAVSKKQDPDAVEALSAAGFTVFGESRVQEAAQKIPLCSSRLEWHFVGHLQTNKARAAVGLFRMLHAVDSWRLMEALERVCDEEGVRLPVLVEVNVAAERSKFGLAPADVPALLEQCAGLRRVRVDGLMTVPPFDPDPERARPYFASLRAHRDRWAQASGLALPHLSMGMSADFEIAIAEGATMIRPGTCLFGERGKG